VYFIVSLRVYVCDYDRASVSGLLRPFLSFGFYPLNLHSPFCGGISNQFSIIITPGYIIMRPATNVGTLKEAIVGLSVCPIPSSTRAQQ